MKTIITIQARTDSERLPSKILKDINGKPLFKRLHERLEGLLPIIWCIPEGKRDNTLAWLLESYGYNVFRGDYDNVHKRLIDCADKYQADSIVRVTGDNPLTDRGICKILVNAHRLNRNEYTYTTDAPKGIKCEVVNVDRMRQTCKNAEHLTWDFVEYEKKQNVSTGIGYPNLRLTVDCVTDLERVRKIYRQLGDHPCIQEIISMIYSESGRQKYLAK